MRKIFTLIAALVAFVGVASASTTDDLSALKHSYVLVADQYTNNGTGTRSAGQLFGDDHFLDVKGGSVSASKGSFDLSTVDGTLVTEDIATKYGSYGTHLNSLRVKNHQDYLAINVTAGTKLIIFENNNNKFTGDTPDRIVSFGKTADQSDEELATFIGHDGGSVRAEWTAPDDGVYYIFGHGGDQFISYIIVQANEAAGTPDMTVGEQTYENGLWYRQVTITPNDADGVPTVVTYTTDGSDPTASSTKYTAPFNVYANATVKAQAFYNYGDDTPAEGNEVTDANGANVGNEASVSFTFDAPTITDDGNGNVTVSTEYENATNYVSYLDQTDVETSSFTLTQSASVTAYTVITNGSYGEFETASTTQTVYVFDETVGNDTIDFAKAAIEEDAENSTSDEIVYKFSDITTVAPSSKFYFDATPVVGIVSDSQYQVDNDSVYLKMSNASNLSFEVAEGDSVDVKVITSLNSCKDVTDVTTTNSDGNLSSRINAVKVDGETYAVTNDDTTADFNNTITFGLGSGVHTFQKYSGTGNILVKSIAFKKVSATGIQNIEAADESTSLTKPVKVIENGRLVIKSAKGTFSIDGARIK